MLNRWKHQASKIFAVNVPWLSYYICFLQGKKVKVQITCEAAQMILGERISWGDAGQEMKNTSVRGSRRSMVVWKLSNRPKSGDVAYKQILAMEVRV